MIKQTLKNFFAVATIAFFASSCTQSKEIKPTILEGETATLPNAAPADANASLMNTTSQPQSLTPFAGGAGLNPEHGKPGHRCDISVGAPLNSPPGNTAAAPPQVMPAPVSAPAAAPENLMNLAINPAHGEPGHSCAISVGAPFK